MFNPHQIDSPRQAGAAGSAASKKLAHTRLNMFANHLNHVSGTDVDFNLETTQDHQGITLCQIF